MNRKIISGCCLPILSRKIIRSDLGLQNKNPQRLQLSFACNLRSTPSMWQTGRCLPRHFITQAVTEALPVLWSRQGARGSPVSITLPRLRAMGTQPLLTVYPPSCSFHGCIGHYKFLHAAQWPQPLTNFVVDAAFQIPNRDPALLLLYFGVVV